MAIFLKYILFFCNNLISIFYAKGIRLAVTALHKDLLAHHQQGFRWGTTRRWWIRPHTEKVAPEAGLKNKIAIYDISDLA
jgi:hypothetical protein